MEIVEYQVGDRVEVDNSDDWFPRGDYVADALGLTNWSKEPIPRGAVVNITHVLKEDHPNGTDFKYVLSYNSRSHLYTQGNLLPRRVAHTIPYAKFGEYATLVMAQRYLPEAFAAMNIDPCNVINDNKSAEFPLVLFKLVHPVDGTSIMASPVSSLRAVCEKADELQRGIDNVKMMDARAERGRRKGVYDE